MESALMRPPWRVVLLAVAVLAVAVGLELTEPPLDFALLDEAASALLFSSERAECRGVPITPGSRMNLAGM